MSNSVRILDHEGLPVCVPSGTIPGPGTMGLLLLSQDSTGMARVPLVNSTGEIVTTASAEDPRNNNFASLIKLEANIGDELRVDDISLGDLYHGRALDGTATSSATWHVVRFYRAINGDITRARFRSSVVWDNRTQGWT